MYTTHIGNKSPREKRVCPIPDLRSITDNVLRSYDVSPPARGAEALATELIRGHLYLNLPMPLQCSESVKRCNYPWRHDARTGAMLD